MLHRAYVLLMLNLATLHFASSAVYSQQSDQTRERFAPRADASAIHWDYSLLNPYQGVGLRYSKAFNNWFAYGIGGRTLVTTAVEGGTATRYLFSIMPVSQFIFRYPEIMSNLWRPYFVSELNYQYQFSDAKSIAAVSGRSGVEFFASQNFAVAVEIGMQLPFYRNSDAVLPTGGIVSVVGAWYF
jgi:hypothetical protein